LSGSFLKPPALPEVVTLLTSVANKLIVLLSQLWFNRLNYAKSALAMPETLSRWASWLKADFLLVWKAGILAR
jgi:hypothetical protein